METRQTRDQLRAAHALERVRRIEAKDARTRLLSLPSMIQENGILVTQVFLSGKQELQIIAKSIEEWLFSPEARIPWGGATQGDLAKRMQAVCVPVFQMVTYEGLLYANWLKRWAQAYPSAGQAENAGSAA